MFRDELPPFRSMNADVSCSLFKSTTNLRFIPPKSAELPNDLWRFFKNETTEQTVLKSDQENHFLEIAGQRHSISPSRIQSVMEVMDIYEKATSSWATPPETRSRDWFPHPDGILRVSTPINHAVKNKNDPLKRTSIAEMSKDELRDMVKSCQVASIAVFLDQESRESLLQRCPAKMTRLSSDHMNLITCPHSEEVINANLGQRVKLAAFGEKCGLVSQVVTVKLPNELCYERRHAHVTVSYVERISKRSLEDEQSHHSSSYTKWKQSLPLTGTIGMKLANGKKLKSYEEFFLETGIDLKGIKDLIGDPMKMENGVDEGSLKEKICSKDEKKNGSTNAKSIQPPSSSIQEAIHYTMIRCEDFERGLTYKSGNKEKVKKQAIIKEGISRLPSVFSQCHRNLNIDLKTQQVTLRDKSEEHRQSARLYQKKSSEHLTSAKNAFKEGKWKLGEELHKASQDATEKHRYHDEQAERLVFEANNLGRVNTHTIDLHHLLLPEALARLKRLMDSLKAFVEDVKTIYRLRIITGKGINSLDKTPVLRPAVLKFLEQTGYTGQIDESNHGVILTYIKPKMMQV